MTPQPSGTCPVCRRVRVLDDRGRMPPSDNEIIIIFTEEPK